MSKGKEPQFNEKIVYIGVNKKGKYSIDNKAFRGKIAKRIPKYRQMSSQEKSTFGERLIEGFVKEGFQFFEVKKNGVVAEKRLLNPKDKSDSEIINKGINNLIKEEEKKACYKDGNIDKNNIINDTSSSRSRRSKRQRIDTNSEMSVQKEGSASTEVKSPGSSSRSKRLRVDDNSDTRVQEENTIASAFNSSGSLNNPVVPDFHIDLEIVTSFLDDYEGIDIRAVSEMPREPMTNGLGNTDSIILNREIEFENSNKSSNSKASTEGTRSGSPQEADIESESEKASTFAERHPRRGKTEAVLELMRKGNNTNVQPSKPKTLTSRGKPEAYTERLRSGGSRRLNPTDAAIYQGRT